MECKHFEFPVTYFVILRRPWTPGELVFENPVALRRISNEAPRIEENSGGGGNGVVFIPSTQGIRVRFRNVCADLNFKC